MYKVVKKVGNDGQGTPLNILGTYTTTFHLYMGSNMVHIPKSFFDPYFPNKIFFTSNTHPFKLFAIYLKYQNFSDFFIVVCKPLIILISKYRAKVFKFYLQFNYL